jgi:hypothetical protein
MLTQLETHVFALPLTVITGAMLLVGVTPITDVTVMRPPPESLVVCILVELSRMGVAVELVVVDDEVEEEVVPDVVEEVVVEVESDGLEEVVVGGIGVGGLEGGEGVGGGELMGGGDGVALGLNSRSGVVWHERRTALTQSESRLSLSIYTVST